MIEWTDELRALVFSTRTAPNPKYLALHLGRGSSGELGGLPIDEAAAYENARDWNHRREIGYVEKGLPHASPALRRASERALEERARKKPPAGTLDVDVEAALVALDLAHTWSIVPYWIAKAGIAFALRALVRVHGLEPSNNKHGYGSGKIWIEESWDYQWQVDADTAWHVLRGAITLCPETEYAELVRVAGALRASAPPLVRAAIGFAFPDERAWVASDAAAVIADPKSWHGDTRMLVTNADVDQAEALARTESGRSYGDDHLVTILARCGEPGTRVIDALIRGAGRAELRKDFAKILALVATTEAASLFGTWLTNKAVAPIASTYFKRHPDLAKAALEMVARGKTVGANAAALAIETSAGGATKRDERPPSVDASRVPPILAAPPWIAPKAAVVLEGITPLAFTPTLDFTPAERASDAADVAQWEASRKSEKDWKDDATLARWAGNRSQMYLFWIARIGDTKLALSLWDEKAPGFWMRPENALQGILLRHGETAIPSLLRYAAARGTDAMSGLTRVVSPTVATMLAAIRVRTKSVRPAADTWLRAHPEVAAIGLVPDAVGPLGTARSVAELALSYLRSVGHGAIVDDVASRYGAPVAAVIAAIDPRNAFPNKLPKLPPFASPAALPAVVLRAGGSLPESAVTHLLTMLAFHDLATPYVGLDEVRAFCTEESLREFAWALFERWLASAAPPKEQWALTILGDLGDDEIVRRLVPKVRAWPKEKAIARAQLGLAVLGRIGTELALVHVDAIAQSFPFASLKEKAQEVIREIGERRGLTADQLSDRLTPTLGLDADGSRALDFGPRVFRVGFDEHLTPIVRDANGKTLRELPKPAKSDDAAKAKEATAIWKALRADAKAIGTRQIARLERAMIDERTWSSDEHERFFRRHPLLGHLSRRVLWASTVGATRSLFRIAEDGTLADATDRPFTPPPEARISVVHPLRLDAKARAPFEKLFADYEIVQPFPQLARPTFALGEDPSALLARAGTVEPGRIRALRARGFDVDGESWVSYLVKRIPIGADEATVLVDLDPGFGIADEIAPQKLTGLTLRVGSEERPLASLPPIAFSELFVSLLT